MVFPVVMYGYELDYKEGWVWKNWCFWIGVLERTLENPLNRKKIKPINLKGNQPWISIGRFDAEAEAPILYIHLMQSASSLEKTLMLGNIEGKRRSGWKRMRWLDSIADSMSMNLSQLWQIVQDREACMLQSMGVTKSQTWLNNWTTSMPSFRDLGAIWFVVLSCCC